MENLKIRVATAQESKEAQELLVSIGGVAYDAKQDRLGLIIFANNIIYSDWLTHEKHYDSSYELKEITLPQLRDMVVLKRNDPKDATHYHEYEANNFPYYLALDGWYFFCRGKWEESNHNEDFYSRLKPIEKEMKEYLDPDNGYDFIKWSGFAHPPESFIEVPNGANKLTIDDSKTLTFWSDDGESINVGQDVEWRDESEEGILSWRQYAKYKHAILWQRETLNDKVASAEVVRQELKRIDATLAERESTYGSFTQVANTTGQLMAVILNSPNGHTIPYAHEEALHMICSKIARIVNGDINHADSWHDIGGYAKLIEDIIQGEAS